MSYQFMVLIPPDNPLTLEALKEHLTRFFGARCEVTASATEPAIAVSEGGWALHLYWEMRSHVKQESAEIARRFAADHRDKEGIAACDRRISVYSDDDPDMRHFNTYARLLEALDEIEGVYLFDPYAGTFGLP